MSTLRLLLASFLVSGPALAAGSAEGALTAPPTMQWQVRDLTVLQRVAPAVPAGATLQALEAQVVCKAAVSVAGSGEPASIAVDGCPAEFAEETYRALEQWRWEPWGSVGERRVSMSIKFPVPRPAPVVPPADFVPPHLAASHSETASLSLPPMRAAGEQIVCAGSIVRNRQGVARRVDVDSCPSDYRDAAEEAMKELARQEADRADRSAPLKRVQPVSVTFAVGRI